RRRMAVIVLAAQLALRRQVGHDIFDACELASICRVGSARHLLNLILDCFYSVAWIRVVREKLSRLSLSLLGLQLFKQLGHFDWVVSSFGHDLGAVVIRLTLGGSGHLEQHRAGSQSNAQLTQLSQQSAAAESSGQHERKL